ncbi:hypothetical protein [Clostridiisalibacter paucivorans]|uniref:hypothetical protein n=1 Tax=Clostridiisalibacter paucivorans TaxID=408753 RepID=UPI000685A9BB|nr:hypothetical protein [Clostridiisalibacter paucivorans]
MPKEKCALCHEYKDLELSHIVPKFVIRHLKKTSFGAIRNMENPNRVVQDGEKHYMLCGDCEDLFSAYETKFANKFFYPYMNDSIKEFDYDQETYYFLTSISWRSLYLDILDFVKNHEVYGVDLTTLEILIQKEKSMREYLLKINSEIDGIEHHIFFFDDLVDVEKSYPELRPHVTFHRGITSYTFFNKELNSQATITNMMGIILFSLYSKGPDEYWENTEICNGVGQLKAKNQIIKSFCANELNEILDFSKQRSDEISEKQKSKIVDKIKVDPEKFAQSKVFEDLKKDFGLE